MRSASLIPLAAWVLYGSACVSGDSLATRSRCNFPITSLKTEDEHAFELHVDGTTLAPVSESTTSVANFLKYKYSSEIVLTSQHDHSFFGFFLKIACFTIDGAHVDCSDSPFAKEFQESDTRILRHVGFSPKCMEGDGAIAREFEEPKSTLHVMLVKIPRTVFSAQLDVFVLAKNQKDVSSAKNWYYSSYLFNFNTKDDMNANFGGFPMKSLKPPRAKLPRISTKTSASKPKIVSLFTPIHGVTPSSNDPDYQHRIALDGRDDLFFYWNEPEGDETNAMLSARIRYFGQGWLGFGVSAFSEGKMIGSEVVIGLPAENKGTSNPGKYRIKDKSVDGVQLMKESSQTLQDASIVQDDSSTVLTFKKLLMEPEELLISASDVNTFIWAVGADNNLAHHASRGILRLDLSPRSSDDPDFEKQMQLDDDGLLSFYWNKPVNTGSDAHFTARLRYSGIGWIGWGVSSDPKGAMIGSEAVIGLPGFELDITNPGKYRLSAKSNEGVVLMDESSQTLRDATIGFENNGADTVLTFTKLLEEPGEISIKRSGTNSFIWAYGVSDTLSHHENRGVYFMDFSEVPVPTASPTSNSTSNTSFPTMAPSSSNATEAPTNVTLPTMAPTSSNATEEPTNATLPTMAPSTAPSFLPTMAPSTSSDATLAPTSSKPTLAPTSSNATGAPTNAASQTKVPSGLFFFWALFVYVLL